MASEATASSADGLTPAQKLMEQHDHHATVEDVVDEDDLAHPPPSAAVQPASDTAAPLSDKAAGKQKAQDAPVSAKKPALNTASEDAFPALGPVKPRAQASVAPTWGKKPAAVISNGVNGSTGSSGTPASLPIGRGPALPTMNIPGKHTERISFSPNQLTPRQQLKKPVNDIIRDINRRSKAKLEYKSGPGGAVVFESTGPVDAVRQSLKEIANEVGSKVSLHHINHLGFRD